MSPRPDQRTVDSAFARLFATADGRVVLAELERLTLRTILADASDQTLRAQEGKRALFNHITTTIERGKHG
ncbi:hypothetical protein [Magnetospirillum moscoviense]|uniref:Bbp19-like phage domain-containing protein n=1 Tax=Magnetospirillum moscoviense TaxID=1437059 RepID=A0A178MPW8_9PROT|nr:hypothetical protein [Magnetospirillum moscoviense]OAN50689.1 hypothetical protein A6A05_11835 [Magnetospirillum moscoviense]